MTGKKIGDNSKAYPEEMRTQLWPLCCGAQIISGFKQVGTMTPEEIVAQVNSLCDTAIPDHQVYTGETIRPAVTFLTLNQQQMGSKTIRQAVKKAGFVLYAKGTGRNPHQGFFVRQKGTAFRVLTPEEIAAEDLKAA